MVRISLQNWVFQTRLINMCRYCPCSLPCNISKISRNLEFVNYLLHNILQSPVHPSRSKMFPTPESHSLCNTYIHILIHHSPHSWGCHAGHILAASADIISNPSPSSTNLRAWNLEQVWGWYYTKPLNFGSHPNVYRVFVAPCESFPKLMRSLNHHVSSRHQWHGFFI